MIISASRRTDIPSYYSDWFFSRIKEGYVYVRNPMNIHKISKISLSPDIVDGIVFWTKNPTPMIERLNEINNYPYYFQFTLNAYGKDVERNIPSKNDIIIPSFQKLSKQIGKDRVVWRYDPIFLNEKYTIEYHCKYFEILASKLHKFTDKCTVSFIDYYPKTERNMKQLQIASITMQQKLELMEKISSIADNYDLQIDTCAEEIDVHKFGFTHSHCIDKELLEKIIGCTLDVKKDKNQRIECGCFESIDIGMYNTCKNGCLYCYANYNSEIAQNQYTKHINTSPLLCGEIEEIDEIKERVVKSCKNCQVTLFD